MGDIRDPWEVPNGNFDYTVISLKHSFVKASFFLSNNVFVVLETWVLSLTWVRSQTVSTGPQLVHPQSQLQWVPLHLLKWWSCFSVKRPCKLVHPVNLLWFHPGLTWYVLLQQYRPLLLTPLCSGLYRPLLRLLRLCSHVRGPENKDMWHKVYVSL